MTLKWLWILTGGRPMRYIRTEFVDAIVDRPVNSYMDRNGRYWWAFTAWDWDRMRMDGEMIIDALSNRSPKPSSPETQYDAARNMILATVVNSDGSTTKEWVDARHFQETMAAGIATLDSLRLPAVSLLDDYYY